MSDDTTRLATTTQPLPVEVRRVPMADRLTDVTLDIAAITEETPVEVVAEARGRVECLKRLVRELDNAIDERTTNWIVTNKQDLVIGSIRWYVGPKRKTKARDNAAVLRVATEIALDRACGDEAEASRIVAQFLASDAWKPGGLRKWLEDEGEAQAFSELFEVTEETELREGKPVKKVLQSFNETFAR